MPKWKPEMINQFHQDDIYFEMTFLRTLEVPGWVFPQCCEGACARKPAEPA